MRFDKLEIYETMRDDSQQLTHTFRNVDFEYEYIGGGSAKVDGKVVAQMAPAHDNLVSLSGNVLEFDSCCLIEPAPEDASWGSGKWLLMQSGET